MSPELGRFWFRVAFLFTLISLGLLPFQQPGSAEFVLTVTSLGIGLLFIGILVIIIRRSH